MKKEIIKTDNYLLVVDDSEIKRGDWFLTDDKRIEQSAPDWNPREWHKKIISHLPLNDSPILEGVPLLPPLEVEDDVESMSFNPSLEYKKMYDDANTFDFRKGFVEGYNKAREKYKFTEEDMVNFACKVYNENYHKDDSFFTTAETLIKSFSQPKTPTHFEFEIERKSVLNLGIEPFNPNTHVYTNEPKITTNSQGQEVACGKYIY